MWGLFRRAKAAPSSVPPPSASPLDLSGYSAIYAVGDVHGCLGLLLALEQFIVEDAAADGHSKPAVLLLGDFIDRGVDSAGTLNHVRAGLAGAFPLLALSGNHEEAMLAFLSDPASSQSWLSFGGSETLVSYGIDTPALRQMSPKSTQYADALLRHIPNEHRRFLRQLPTVAHSHGYRFQHAPDGVPSSGSETVVHGHIMVPDSTITEASINVDVGAYRFGRLCAVRIVPDGPPVFLEVNRQGAKRRWSGQ